LAYREVKDFIWPKTPAFTRFYLLLPALLSISYHLGGSKNVFKGNFRSKNDKGRAKFYALCMKMVENQQNLSGQFGLEAYWRD